MTGVAGSRAAHTARYHNMRVKGSRFADRRTVELPANSTKSVGSIFLPGGVICHKILVAEHARRKPLFR
jgi:hypothetical protein